MPTNAPNATIRRERACQHSAFSVQGSGAWGSLLGVLDPTERPASRRSCMPGEGILESTPGQTRCATCGTAAWLVDPDLRPNDLRLIVRIRLRRHAVCFPTMLVRRAGDAAGRQVDTGIVTRAPRPRTRRPKGVKRLSPTRPLRVPTRPHGATASRASSSQLSRPSPASVRASTSSSRPARPFRSA